MQAGKRWAALVAGWAAAVMPILAMSWGIWRRWKGMPRSQSTCTRGSAPKGERECCLFRATRIFAGLFPRLGYGRQPWRGTRCDPSLSLENIGGGYYVVTTCVVSRRPVEGHVPLALGTEYGTQLAVAATATVLPSLVIPIASHQTIRQA